MGDRESKLHIYRLLELRNYFFHLNSLPSTKATLSFYAMAQIARFFGSRNRQSLHINHPK